jgi:hypothetical protein
MTLDEVALVLGKCAGIDQRTIGRADVLAWHELIGHLQLADALEAVKRWYGARRDRIMPSDIIDGVRAIHNERAHAEPHEVRALPSRFEADQVRDERIARGLDQLATRLSIPEDDDGLDAHSRALQRARRERGRRPVPTTTTLPKRDTKPVDLGKIQGPAWADPQAREAAAVRELHQAGRSCGKPMCPRCAPAELTPQEQP